jgi:hypothetical protein
VIKIVKKLATLLLALSFISMSCAATHGAVPLGGNPRVETIGLTVGLTVEELDAQLGTPHGVDTCALPFKANGQDAMAQGRAFLWNHENTNIPAGQSSLTEIVVCVIDGIAVSEHREWKVRSGLLISVGHNTTVNFELVQEIMDGLLKAGPDGYKPKLMPNSKGFEI